MRKKRHFDERMSATQKWLLARGAGGILNMKEAAENYRALVDYKAVFGNDNPVDIEIGCGKGGFLCELAKRNPDRNYIGVEMVSNVVISAMENAEKQGAENVRFLNIRAECLPCYIPEESVENIYLNFSTPLPKLGYVSQRLTYRGFLEMYKKLLADGGKVVQKTDNRDFFDFSLEEYRACGFELTELTYNLHENGSPEWNIITEYERKWVEQGLPIHRVVALKKSS
ncbi:MAG: tRNA (guanosine(46)-N7)-methyltransferase TrmB [Clostridia bacterium]|nr:tRNA (guanosine(46)-N7)-methyltransferase TrmB [Clostridia bacterium]